jgi:hypothetical protein
MHKIARLFEKIPFALEIALATKAIIDFRLRGPAPHILDSQLAAWSSTVRRDGVCVVENFVSEEACASLRTEIDSLMFSYSNAVQIDVENSDHRLFLGNSPPGGVGKFYANHRLNTCASAILGGGVINLAVLAGRLEATPGNVGSGGGWHRDSFTNQFKAIIYASDVNQDNGPFQYLHGSHRINSMIRDRRRAGLGITQRRVSDGQVRALVSETPDRLRTFLGGAGTLILADTTGLHRGMPIAVGTRYSLTNYYFAPRTITSARKDHFKPILGDHVPYNRAANSSMESM